MESSLQKIIAAIVGVLILFIIPVYIAFEKVDDISYSLAVKLTQNFVDNVRNKGYISPEMYSDFVAGLFSTNNVYDVTIEHVKKRQDPAIYIYSPLVDETTGDYERDLEGKLIKDEVLHVLDYDKYIQSDGTIPAIIELSMKQYITEESKVGIERTVEYKNGEDCIIEKAHVTNEEYITDRRIVQSLLDDTDVTKAEFFRQCLRGNADMYNSLAYMNQNSYIMNEGDQINVKVRNKNRTIASIFYSMLTANVGNEEVAKVYVEYGGTIKNDGISNVSNELGSVNDETGRLFKYTGKVQEITLEPGTYSLECWGAAGGHKTLSGDGSRGAYVATKAEFGEEITLYIYVGGKGSLYSEFNQNNGGYNGGGNSYNGYGGGGASDIRLLKGDSQDIPSLLSRIIVAGGGGGASGYIYEGETSEYLGGSGGVGKHSQNKHSWPYYGHGAAQDSEVGYGEYEYSEKGRFGVGGSVELGGAGAGGSGYFGGSAAHNEYLGGGGGGSYVYSSTGVNPTPQKCDKDGKMYPMSKAVSGKYYTSLDEISHLFSETTGEWNNITISLADLESSDGDQYMKDPLEFNGSETMKGNTGNGYVRIKKLS